MRCKNCKIKFEPRFFNQKFCMQKNDCIQAHLIISKKIALDKKVKEMKKEVYGLKPLQESAKRYCHKYIKLRDKDLGCISCGTFTANTYHAGHYLESGNNSFLRYHEDNIHKQCGYNCNIMRSGNTSLYRINLIKKIGVEKVEWLESNAKKVKKWTEEELKNIIDYYKQKIKELN